MPTIGLALGGTDFAERFVLLRVGETPGPYLMLDAAKEAGALTITNSRRLRAWSCGLSSDDIRASIRSIHSPGTVAPSLAISA